MKSDNERVEGVFRSLSHIFITHRVFCSAFTAHTHQCNNLQDLSSLARAARARAAAGREAEGAACSSARMKWHPGTEK